MTESMQFREFVGGEIRDADDKERVLARHLQRIGRCARPDHQPDRLGPDELQGEPGRTLRPQLAQFTDRPIKEYLDRETAGSCRGPSSPATNNATLWLRPRTCWHVTVLFVPGQSGFMPEEARTPEGHKRRREGARHRPLHLHEARTQGIFARAGAVESARTYGCSRRRPQPEIRSWSGLPSTRRLPTSTPSVASCFLGRVRA